MQTQNGFKGQYGRKLLYFYKSVSILINYEQRDYMLNIFIIS